MATAGLPAWQDPPIDKPDRRDHEMDDPTLPQSPDASALLIDRSGNLWYGKNAQGLCKINLNAPVRLQKICICQFLKRISW